MSPENQGNEEKRPFHPDRFREEFSLFSQPENETLAYLDNAATSQTPRAVLEALNHFYTRQNANIHRGVYRLSLHATDAYDRARQVVADYLNAESAREIIFVRGATEGINLVARSFLEPRLEPGDEILLTETEHHANFVPWQMVAEATGARLRLVPVLEDQSLDVETGLDLLGDKTRMLALVQGSNATGNRLDIKPLLERARERGIPSLVDACQTAAHGPLDVQALECDFLVFSGHKVYGPTGIGALYGKLEHLDSMPPYQGGGDMIDRVSLEGTRYADPPQRFEAGTPHIAGALGLAAALDFLQGWDLPALQAHEWGLWRHAAGGLAQLPGVHLLGDQSDDRLPVVSFTIDGLHSHDLATFLDMDGIAIRAGHHCCQPLMRKLGIPGSNRASFAPYNNVTEVNRLIAGVEKTIQFFK